MCTMVWLCNTEGNMKNGEWVENCDLNSVGNTCSYITRLCVYIAGELNVNIQNMRDTIEN